MAYVQIEFGKIAAFLGAVFIEYRRLHGDSFIIIIIVVVVIDIMNISGFSVFIQDAGSFCISDRFLFLVSLS